jgi:hypothetical protein
MKKIIHLMSIWVLLTLSCTNPFSGRDSEAPLEPEGTYETPIDPGTVLINLENSYNEKIITNFEKCLDEGFFFHCDHLAFGDEADSGWAYSIERSLTEKMFTQYRKDADSRTLSLALTTSPGGDQLGDTTAVFYREYSLIEIANIDKGAPDTTSYVGTAVFYLVETGFNLWAVRTWTDLRQSDQDATWAQFKNGFR